MRNPLEGYGIVEPEMADDDLDCAVFDFEDGVLDDDDYVDFCCDFADEFDDEIDVDNEGWEW